MKAAIFLDRDGVINEVLTKRVKFVNQPEDFYLLQGVGQAIHMLNQTGYPVFVVTNQGGVGLGYMAESDLQAIHQKMEADLKEENAFVTEIAYCPHKPYAGCHCRKPKAGMLHTLAAKHKIDLEQSFMVGDRQADIEAGKAAGTLTVRIGETEKVPANYHFSDLLSFATWISSLHGHDH